jgi:uncharacterized protein (TIGR00661 family)
MHQPKRILVCPLDWGLGHATRCIPIIRMLVKKGAEVLIAADERPFAVLKLEFPDLQFVKFPGYSISYPDKGSMTLKMLLSVPRIIKGIRKEHADLDKLVDDHKIDIVISDNRYGCWSKKTKNIFITHQLMIKSPFAEILLHKIVLNHIKNYNECWIPDAPVEINLSGDLSHKFPAPDNSFFIGPLSRFDECIQNSNAAKLIPGDKYDLLAIISGPEPQRTNFENILLNQIEKTDLKALIVLGKPEKVEMKERNRISIVSHLKSEDLCKAILNSNLIIARSGYSTIMDLSSLNKKAILIPTPGQTEQEYLAEMLMEKKIAFTESQSKFDLNTALKFSKNYSGFNGWQNSNLLEARINSILSLT